MKLKQATQLELVVSMLTMLLVFGFGLLTVQERVSSLTGELRNIELQHQLFTRDLKRITGILVEMKAIVESRRAAAKNH